MAFTSAVTSAKLNLATALTALERITFTDVESVPQTTVNWAAGTVLPNLNLQLAAGTPSASNPVEVASTAVWGDLRTAGGTTDSLDLTALPRSTELGVLDLDGLKLQAVMFASAFANTGDITITPDAVTGYPLFSGATDSFDLSPGGIAILFRPENTTAGTGWPDVSATVKDIDLSGPSGFIYQVVLYAG